MTFTISDFREWVNILHDHPEWREELRRLVLTDELLELPSAVRKLIEVQREFSRAQERTEMRLEELAEAQGRTEMRLEELAEVQGRTEKRLEKLAGAQMRTEKRVEELAVSQRELAKAQDRLGSAVGELGRAFGSTVEEEAASVIEVVLRDKDYRVLKPAYSLPMDGEIDVVLPLEDPAGKKVWAVVEAKARLSRRDVHNWSQRMNSEGWHKKLAKHGVKGPYLVYAYSIRADLGAHEMAEEKGIGLLKSDGETLAPRDLIEPVDP